MTEKEILEQREYERYRYLMRLKDDLYNDESISDDEYYLSEEKITNIIANEFSLEDIEKFDKKSASESKGE